MDPNFRSRAPGNYTVSFSSAVVEREGGLKLNIFGPLSCITLANTGNDSQRFNPVYFLLITKEPF